MRRLALLLISLAGCGDSVESPDAEPNIIARLPGEDAAAVSVGTDIRVTFSSPVSASSLSSVMRLQLDGQSVPATIAAADARTIVLTPSDVLDPATRYAVEIGSGAGLQPHSWTFTTAGTPAPELDTARLRVHLRALADDSMLGRKAGTAEERKAAEYIRDEFARYGLVAFGAGQWFQDVSASNFLGSSQNVIATIAGRGALASEWIVVGAHYDHIGVRNGQIYNGADDNASGTTALLEIARALAQHSVQNGFGSDSRRSVMLVAFGAEEAGLVGSYRLCQSSPWIPMAAVAAMLNLDMIGRLRDDKVYVEGMPTAAEWPLLLNRYEAALLYIGASVNSDQRCYIQAGRPALGLHTGLHPQYHQPDDDVHLVDVAGAAKITRLALHLVINLTVRPRSLTR